MKIAVTAASGALGGSIVSELLSRGLRESLVAVARRPGKVTIPDIEIRSGDYTDRDALQAAFAGVEVVLLVSGMAHPDERIGQHRNVIEGARTAGVRKIVYTSIYGIEGKCSFDAIIKSNRQTETDVRESGLDFAIGRNGLYIDADLEAAQEYATAGKIINCAGSGLCGYTSRNELAVAYAHLILDDAHNGTTSNLCGEPVSQAELAEVIGAALNTPISFQHLSEEAYLADRIAAHGPFLGGVIAGIYQGIAQGAFDVPSDFEALVGRGHKSLEEMVAAGLRIADVE